MYQTLSVHEAALDKPDRPRKFGTFIANFWVLVEFGFPPNTKATTEMRWLQCEVSVDYDTYTQEATREKIIHAIDIFGVDLVVKLKQLQKNMIWDAATEVIEAQNDLGLDTTWQPFFDGIKRPCVDLLSGVVLDEQCPECGVENCNCQKRGI